MKIKLLNPLFILLTSILFLPDSRAAITLPAIFGDNMVLQQKSDVAFWGSATPGKNVTIKTSWNGKSYSVRSGGDGKWKTKIPTPVAGGPYTITISDGKPVTLKNVLIGEVWVCSGQSNMEMKMRGYNNQPVTGSNEYIATSANNNIRLMTIQRKTSLTPVDEIEGEWNMCSPESVADFSATAWFFGLMLNKVLDVPIGLISTSWSGTRIEPWMTEESLREFDWVTLPDKGSTETNIPVQTPTVLYNGMVAPIAGFGIRGAIWYQGESNRLEPARYRELLPKMIAGWRSVWGLGEFPFYFTQIAPFDYGIGELKSAYLREAQLKALEYIPNSGMACLMDTGEKENIHPANKKAAGDRLAFQALAKTYGLKGIASDGPTLKEMTVEGNIIKLTFNNAQYGLTSYGKELTSFEVAGANRRFYPAKAIITGSGITVICPSVSTPVAVRYAFRDFIKGELFNTAGLPASSFRTDDW
ncbi:MAG: sialate O-acetylesterase [Bacteroidales bacterium]